MKIILLTSPFDYMPRGKYRNMRIQDIIESDPNYATWMVANMSGIIFSKLIKDTLTTWKHLSR